jgi:hypothetical protein
MELLKSRELAGWARNGLASRVPENNLAWGMADEGSGPSANILGFMVLGKLGALPSQIKRALRLFEDAALNSATGSEAEDPIERELGLDVNECMILAAANMLLPAEEIVGQLEAGTFDWEGESAEGCAECLRDIDAFFRDEAGAAGEEKGTPALNRALEHMTRGSTVQSHRVSCRPCWAYYMSQKRAHCGG